MIIHSLPSHVMIFLLVLGMRFVESVTVGSHASVMVVRYDPKGINFLGHAETMFTRCEKNVSSVDSSYFIHLSNPKEKDAQMKSPNNTSFRQTKNGNFWVNFFHLKLHARQQYPHLTEHSHNIFFIIVEITRWSWLIPWKCGYFLFSCYHDVVACKAQNAKWKNRWERPRNKSH